MYMCRVQQLRFEITWIKTANAECLQYSIHRLSKEGLRLLVLHFKILPLRRTDLIAFKPANLDVTLRFYAMHPEARDFCWCHCWWLVKETLY